MLSGFLLSLCVLLISWFIIRLFKIGSRQIGLPPGPPTLPLLGNVHIFPTKNVHLQFTNWANTYGEIYSLKIGPETMVILSSARLVHQLLDQRSATTSDRPQMHLVQVITEGLNMVFMPYDQLWKDFRRAMRDMLSREACIGHLSIQHAEGTQLMYDLWKKPQGFDTHIQRYSASVMLSVAFGIRSPRFENSYISEFFEVQRKYEHIMGLGMTPPMDIFPIFKYVPERWASWKTTAKNLKESQQKLWYGLVDMCQKRILENRRSGGFLEHILDNGDHYSFDKPQTAYLGGITLEAGADTTSVFIQSFIAIMINYPEVQKRAQREIDEVIGSSRSPVYDDFESLPYLQAVLSEVHRFRPTVPTIIPHVTTTDERIDEYLIPKGTIIFSNMWGIYRDSNSFEHPDIFDPDRFLKSEFGTKEGADDTGRRHDMVFGSGKRICPGMELATNSLKINTMNLLWGFDMDYAKDLTTGKPFPIDLNDMTDGVLLTQQPFKCDIRPRSQAHADIIVADYAAAREIFAPFEMELSEDERRHVVEW